MKAEQIQSQPDRQTDKTLSPASSPSKKMRLKSERFQDSIRQEIKIKLKPDWDTHKGKGKGALLA